MTDNKDCGSRQLQNIMWLPVDSTGIDLVWEEAVTRERAGFLKSLPRSRYIDNADDVLIAGCLEKYTAHVQSIPQIIVMIIYKTRKYNEIRPGAYLQYKRNGKNKSNKCNY